MIETLTPEQEALIPIIRYEWIKIGLDTSPTDKQASEEAIALAYQWNWPRGICSPNLSCIIG